MPIHLLALAIAIIGLVIFALFEGKPSEVGRDMFFTGLLAFLLTAK
jgi:hypothetical protein